MLFLLPQSYLFLSLLFLLPRGDVVGLNELDELDVVVFQLVAGVLKGYGLALALVVQVLDLLLDGVIRQLHQEHLLLLVHELVDVLRALLSGELHA